MAIPQKYRDLAARAAWTGAAGIIGVIGAPAVVEAIDSTVKTKIPVALQAVIPSVAIVFSAIKSFLATKVGDPTRVTFNSPKDKAVREAARVLADGSAVVAPPSPTAVIGNVGVSGVWSGGGGTTWSTPNGGGLSQPSAVVLTPDPAPVLSSPPMFSATPAPVFAEPPAVEFVDPFVQDNNPPHGINDPSEQGGVE